MSRHLFLYIFLFLAMPVMAQRDVLRKLSPSLRMMVMQEKGKGYRCAPMMADNRRLCAFVKVGEGAENALLENDCRVLASFGDIHIVSLPLSNVPSLAKSPAVHRIEVGKGTRALNDQLTAIYSTQELYDGVGVPQAFTGRGVVMGIMDIGFDLTNPNFYSSDLSEYRIKAFWDMLSADTEGSSLIVGRDYCDEESILAYAHSRDGLKQTHGTHTLGTAAGTGVDTPYRGVAWESDICLVSNAVTDDREFISDDDLEKFTYATDALGFKYIFDYAESVGRPCVISFSEGSNQDLYGDDILYYEVLERMQGPGRIIVASAGNSSASPNYIHKTMGRESAGTFIYNSGAGVFFMAESASDFSTRLVFYNGSENDTISISTEWLCQQTDSLVYDTLEIAGDKYNLAFGAYPSCYDESKVVVECYVNGPKTIGAKVPLSYEVVGREADIEAFKLLGWPETNWRNPELCDIVSYANINSPSSAPSVISVGASAYRSSVTNYKGEATGYDNGTGGVRGGFSSVGPTLDGRIKPDVMAVGANVVSSMNSFVFEANPNEDIDTHVSYTEHQGRTYPWGVMSGTSMSSPVVGGIIALWLEANPWLTHDDIIEIFAHTCRHYDNNMDYPNNEYGYGEIDAYAGLLYAMNISGIKDITPRQPLTTRIQCLQGHILHIEFDHPLEREGRVAVYSANGTMLLHQAADAGMTNLNIQLPESVSGVVVVQVNADTPQSTGSTLIRLY